MKVLIQHNYYSEFKKSIDNGHVFTWSYELHNGREYFTHTTEQWKKKAWLLPKIESNRLVLNIVKPQEGNISSEIYAIYHGRFIESMLVHCDSLFRNAIATALPALGDKVQ